MRKAILWFRNDLRLKDNDALNATRKAEIIYPLYCLDPRHFTNIIDGFPKTGGFRAKFLLESLSELRQNLKALGSDLLIRKGHPEVVIPRLISELQVDAVFGSKEVTLEEVTVEKHLADALAKKAITPRLYWQSTLVHEDQLPWPIAQLPDVFTQFRKKIEKQVAIRPSQEQPRALPYPVNADPGEMPTLKDLGLTSPPNDPRAVLPFKGGEDQAWLRLKQYFWERDKLKNYKYTRNGLLGEDYSSKFSPWLAHGCISPRSIYHQVKRYEQERIKNISTYWLVFELLWRDYFRFIAQKFGHRIFLPKGIKGKPLPYHQDKNLFEQWRSGNTNEPFVDANMRELNATGFMSNRGRQNVASYLAKDLGVNWTWGAAYFESQLIDYDPCSNWGNWCYVAGVGNDPREDRYFNVKTQAERYDPEGGYVKHWLDAE